MGSKNFWAQTKFLVQKILWDQEIWSKNIAIQTNWSPKPNSGLKTFCVQKNLMIKKIWSKKNLSPKKSFVFQRILSQNNFWVQNNFGFQNKGPIRFCHSGEKTKSLKLDSKLK